MAAFFNLELDTTAPAGVTAELEGGAATTTTRDVQVAVATTDSPTTGYQMKIWGDVDGSFDPDVQPLEANSNWISLAGTKSIRLSSGDASKTVRVKIRDDVWNESVEANDSITLDTTAPVIDITVPASAVKVSKVNGKDESIFTWESDVEIAEYKVKVVPTTGSGHTAGTVIGTANGSVNVAATGTFPAATGIQTTINGADLEAADAGDGTKIVKVFGRTAAGNWSA